MTCSNVLNLLKQEAAPGVDLNAPLFVIPDSVPTDSDFLLTSGTGRPSCLVMPQAKEGLSCINLKLLALEIVLIVKAWTLVLMLIFSDTVYVGKPFLLTSPADQLAERMCCQWGRVWDTFHDLLPLPTLILNLFILNAAKPV